MNPCDKEVFEHGFWICTVNGWAEDIESWVQNVAASCGQRVDWHYAQGRAHVLYIGDYKDVRRAVKALTSELIGRVIRIFPPEYRSRSGRQPLPESIGAVPRSGVTQVHRASKNE